ncbi:hypothetical protein D0862_15044 [Hortaea werneckii]|uniref:Proteasome maturation factor UMP1 n=1 Tax=Hortaea werneckii TaxID=91943 RepID=A0A3M7DUQ6_HORWE|nr:hypothetical protein D0862_15044 [Hortaea werneckii]
MTLQIVPTTTNPTQTAAAAPGAPSAPGVHDTLRSNLSLTGPAPKASSASTNPAETAPQSFHPLESRLAKWRTQQESLKMELLRRQFGIAEPVKRQMELGIVRAGEWQPACLGGVTNGANVHADILAGRDCEIGWEDVFTGGEEMRDQADFHAEMERRMGMEW